MSRGGIGTFSGGDSGGSFSSTAQPSLTWGSDSSSCIESSAGREQWSLDGVITTVTGQDLPQSSVAGTAGSAGIAKRKEDPGGGSGSVAAAYSGGTSSSSSGTGESGLSLTGENLRNTSGFYEHLRRERNKGEKDEGLVKPRTRTDAILDVISRVGGDPKS